MKQVKLLFVALNGPDHFKYSLPLGNIKAYISRIQKVKDNCQIKIKNFDHINDPLEGIIFGILNENPDFVGFSCYVWNIETIITLCEAIKKQLPNILTILGGPEVSYSAGKYISECKYIDIIIRGEGEVTFAKLIEEMLTNNPDFKKIKGISYRQGEIIRENPANPPIQDLAMIPSPYLEGTIKAKNIYPAGYIEYSRGCDFSCDYCEEGNRPGKKRYFPLERLKNELEFMNLNNIEVVSILDSAINTDKKRFYEICKICSSIKKDSKMEISVEMKAELIREEDQHRMELSGITMAGIGLQSINPETNKLVGRSFDKEAFRRGVSVLNKSSIKPYIDIIYGLPGDNFFRLVTTIKFAVSLNPHIIYFFYLSILPGTKIWNKAQELGIEFHKTPPYEEISNPSYDLREIIYSDIFTKSFQKEFYEKTG